MEPFALPHIAVDMHEVFPQVGDLSGESAWYLASHWIFDGFGKPSCLFTAVYEGPIVRGECWLY